MWSLSFEYKPNREQQDQISLPETRHLPGLLDKKYTASLKTIFWHTGKKIVLLQIIKKHVVCFFDLYFWKKK